MIFMKKRRTAVSGDAPLRHSFFTHAISFLIEKETCGRGLRVSLDALSSSAAQLFGISLEKPQRVIGKNTIECMRSGIMYGHAAMIDGMIDRMQEELGEPIASVIATGGTSQFVVPLCRHKIIYDKDLLLKGLAILYENELQHAARLERK